MFHPRIFKKLLEDESEAGVVFFHTISIVPSMRAPMCVAPGMLEYLVRTLPNSMGALANLSSVNEHKALVFAKTGKAVIGLANEHALMFLSNIAATVDIYDAVVDVAMDAAGGGCGGANILKTKHGLQILQSLSETHASRLFSRGAVDLAVRANQTFHHPAAAILRNLARGHAKEMCTPEVTQCAAWTIAWSRDLSAVMCALDTLMFLDREYVFAAANVAQAVVGCMVCNESEVARTRAAHVLAHLNGQGN